MWDEAKMSTVFRVRHNVMRVTSISNFAQITGGVNNDCKDVYFVRLLGVNSNYMNDIRAMDQLLGTKAVQGKGFYKRVLELPKLSAYEDTAYYSEQFNKWIESGRTEIYINASACKNTRFRQTLSEACKKTEQIYKECEPNYSESMFKNFMAKVLFWTDFLFGEAYEWDERMNSKIVVRNVGKKQEYFFWYMLSLLGNDVLLLQYEKDIELDRKWKDLSVECVIGSFSHMDIPVYIQPEITESRGQVEKTQIGNDGAIRVVIPKRERRNKEQNSLIVERNNPVPPKVYIPPRVQEPSRVQMPPNVQTASQNQTGARREKTYEELAQMASSVVLIAVHDRSGNVQGTGSGIMIGRKGYILTNDHVARRGQYYSVKIEDDDQVYETDELIKYNSVLDLAVIRINRQLNPLPIYKGPQKLVRGQKVVAIGSPLGLFNSVSDGIISGFRVIDEVDMIQFTAPISNGSSGGAVLNMYGEVIGISTAGIDSGQNINLAMGYECINTFVQGFV